MFFEDMVEVSGVCVRAVVLNQGYVFPGGKWNDEAYINMTNRPGVYRVKVCVSVCVCLCTGHWTRDKQAVLLSWFDLDNQREGSNPTSITV